VTEATIEVPDKMEAMFSQPRGSLMYRGSYGGRGSGKSFTFAKVAAIWGYAEPLRILCTREIQDSIKESFHAELKNAIATEPWLERHYDVGRDYLRGANGTEFIFKGLRHNIGSLKSLAQIDLCIVEEAEDVPEESWLALEPTIRSDKAEMWIIWNPRTEGSPVDKRFRQNPPPMSMIVEMNYSDNPWFPSVLEMRRQHQLQTLDHETYRHIWHGDYLKRSKAQVFHNWEVADFTPVPEWDGPYFGLDFGFAQDPTAGVKMWIHDQVLYFEHEAYANALELDHTPDRLKRDIPGIADHECRADNSRPESISYLKRHGLPRMKPCVKGKGSVEDGIAHMQSYKRIVVHPRCVNTAAEFTYYSYKVDRLSGDVLPVLVDANNHAIDAARYGLEPVMKSRGKGIFR